MQAQMERNRKNHHKKLDDSAKRERARRLAGWTLNALGRLGKHAWAGTKKVGKKIAGWAKNLFKRKTKNSDKQLKNDMKKAKLTFMRQKSKVRTPRPVSSVGVVSLLADVCILLRVPPPPPLSSTATSVRRRSC